MILFWSIRMKVTNSLTQSPRLWSEEEEFWEAMCQLNKQDKGPGPGRRGPCAKIFGVLREGSGCVWCGPLSHQFCNFQKYRIWQNGTSAIANFTFYWLWLGYVQGSIRSRVFIWCWHYSTNVRYVATDIFRLRIIIFMDQATV